MRSLPLWIAAAWWGSLGTLGFFVIPMLFLHLPEPAMAGRMAAKLFSAQTGVSIVCGAGLLLFFRPKWAAARVNIAYSTIIFVAFGMLCALLVEFAVAPKIMARDNMVLWHRVGTALYVLQWVCATVVFAKLAGTPARVPRA